MATATARLASLTLGRDIAAYIAELHAEGLSFERIASQLSTDTDHEIVVAGETVRRWHGEAIGEVAS